MLASEIPDHRSQFGLLMKRQSVVNSPDMALFIPQAVAGFAVRIVGDEVEHRHGLHFTRVLLVQGEVISVLVVMVHV